jgi:hypothetical protein
VQDTLPLLLEGPVGRRALVVVPGPPGADGAPAPEAVLLAALGEDDGRPLHVAAVPLEGGSPGVAWTDVPRLGREALRTAASAALQACDALPPVLALERCLGLGCGFVARCHRGPRGL